MKKNLLMVLLFVFLTACSGNTPAATLTPTATPSPTETPTPTVTPEPTMVPMPEGLTTVPAGFSAVLNPGGTWGYGAGTGTEITSIPNLAVDATGAHVLINGVETDIPVNEIHDRIKIGQAGALQIYNEQKTSIDYAYDAENKVWIKASDILQPDNSNAENYIKYDTIDDWLKSARLEEMVAIPFDPAKTYFPDSNNIYTVDWNNLNPSHSTDSEFNF